MQSFHYNLIMHIVCIYVQALIRYVDCYDSAIYTHNIMKNVKTEKRAISPQKNRNSKKEKFSFEEICS